MKKYKISTKTFTTIVKKGWRQHITILPSIDYTYYRGQRYIDTLHTITLSFICFHLIIRLRYLKDIHNFNKQSE